MNRLTRFVRWLYGDKTRLPPARTAEDAVLEMVERSLLRTPEAWQRDAVGSRLVNRSADYSIYCANGPHSLGCDDGAFAAPFHTNDPAAMAWQSRLWAAAEPIWNSREAELSAIVERFERSLTDGRQQEGTK